MTQTWTDFHPSSKNSVSIKKKKKENKYYTWLFIYWGKSYYVLVSVKSMWNLAEALKVGWHSGVSGHLFYWKIRELSTFDLHNTFVEVYRHGTNKEPFWQPQKNSCLCSWSWKRLQNFSEEFGLHQSSVRRRTNGDISRRWLPPPGVVDPQRPLQKHDHKVTSKSLKASFTLASVPVYYSTFRRSQNNNGEHGRAARMKSFLSKKKPCFLSASTTQEAFGKMLFGLQL